MSFFANLRNAFRESVARLGCITVCIDCVRKKDDVRSLGRFGDFSACWRCGKSTTSRDDAYYVFPTRRDQRR